MRLSPTAHSEKRDFIRMRIDTPASVKVKSEPTNEHETLPGTCLDLSGGGMLLEIEKNFPLGTILEVEIGSDYGHKPMLKAKVQVSRVDASEKENTDIDSKDSCADDVSTEGTQNTVPLPTFLIGVNIIEVLSEE